MKTFIQNGHVITITAPAGGVSSGDGVLVGSLFGDRGVCCPRGRVGRDRDRCRFRDAEGPDGGVGDR